MANFTDYMEGVILNWMRGTTFPATGVMTIALFRSPATNAELEAGTLTNEVPTASTGYSRQTITFGTVSGNQIKNSAAIEWTATANWGTVTHFAIFRGTNMVVWGNLDTNRIVNSGDIFRFPAESITVEVD